MNNELSSNRHTTAVEAAKILSLSPDQIEIAQEIEREGSDLLDDPIQFLAELHSRVGHASYLYANQRDARINPLWILPTENEPGVVGAYANVRTSQIQSGESEGETVLEPHVLLFKKDEQGMVTMMSPDPGQQLQKFTEIAKRSATVPEWLQGPPHWG
jgi:hypothetical protein